MGQSLDIRRRILEITSIASAIIIWEIIARIINKKYILPSFSEVVSAFLELVSGGELYRDIITSLNYFAIGMGLAIAVGIPLGIMMGWFKTFDKAVDPIIEIIRPIPPLAWIPFAIMWFGLSFFVQLCPTEVVNEHLAQLTGTTVASQEGEIVDGEIVDLDDIKT